MKARKQIIPITFLFLILGTAFVIPVTVEALPYPVLEVEGVQEIIGLEVVVYVTAFSDVHPVTLEISVYDGESGHTYSIYSKLQDYFLNTEITLNCSALVEAKDYTLQFSLSDYLGKFIAVTFDVVVDPTKPIFSYFFVDTDLLEYGEIVTVEFTVADDNFFKIEVFVEASNIDTIRTNAGTYELTHSDFIMPHGFTTYMFKVRFRAFDLAGNFVDETFEVTYNFVAFDPELWADNTKAFLQTIGIIIGIYIVAFVLVLLAGKFIKKPDTTTSAVRS